MYILIIQLVYHYINYINGQELSKIRYYTNSINMIKYLGKWLLLSGSFMSIMYGMLQFMNLLLSFGV
jgi:hypothetical protein